MSAMMDKYTSVVLVLFVSCNIISSNGDEDAFICKKAFRMEGEESICSEESKRLKDLEERLAYLEAMIEDQPEISQLPPILKLQHLAIPRDCNAIMVAGETMDGIYQISPDGRCAFNVYCDMQNGGWTVIQRRYDGSVDFARDWLSYVEGFGELGGEFWLGLEKIHRLTTGGSQVYFSLGHYDVSLPNDWAYYESFAVSDVLTGYKMNVDPFGYEGSIKELLSYHNDQKFSTKDRDNDLFSHSCSTRYGGDGGWWYQSCYRLGVLNGYYGVNSTGGNAIWQDGPVYYKSTEIKVKPRLGLC